jgi:hypothetical protein
MRAKVSLSQIFGELPDFDIEKVKPFFLQRGIVIPEEIKTKEELYLYIKEVYANQK